MIIINILNILVPILYLLKGINFPILIIMLWILLIKGSISLFYDITVDDEYKNISNYIDFFTGLIVLLRDITFLNDFFIAMMIISFIKGIIHLIKEVV